MTALDPTPVIAELREEWTVLGQYRPETVDRLIATTERTGELPLPRGGRSTWPHARAYGAGAPVLALVSDLCGERHPELAVLCGGVIGHADAGLDHVAYGADGRVMATWRPDRNRADAR